MSTFSDVVTFGVELDGAGWYDVERRIFKSGKIEHFRWTAAKPVATFKFIGLQYKDVDIRIELAGLITPHILPLLKMSVDGRECNHRFSATNGGFPMFICARSPRQADSPVSEISLRSGRTWSPHELNPMASDRRQLAVAVVKAVVSPVTDSAINPLIERDDVRQFLD